MWPLYRALEDRAKLPFLFVASLAFYAYGEPLGVPLILAVIAWTFAAGIAATRWPRWRDPILGIAIAGLIADLAFFKYWGFLGTLVRLPEVIPPILLPLGISFYTFEAIAYLVDMRRGTTAVERSPLRLGLFISVFPHLISGPIMRPNGFLPQLGHTLVIDGRAILSGLMLFVEGLAKKVLIADLAGSIADRVFAMPTDVGTLVAWTGVLAYTLQIYGDFSGYTDMGRGLARMIGLELPKNFATPYLASSPADFWRRWHISLSSWLRDYLYIPLGGNRRGALRSYVNLFVTMCLGGLWHGAAWTFVLWGAYHGGLLAIQRAIGARIRPILPLAIAGTFLLVVNGWLLFRSRDLGVYAELLRALVLPRQDRAPTVGATSMLFVGVALLGTIGTMAVARWRPDLLERARTPGSIAGAAYGIAAGAALMAVFLRDAPTPFIYFRF